MPDRGAYIYPDFNVSPAVNPTSAQAISFINNKTLRRHFTHAPAPGTGTDGLPIMGGQTITWHRAIKTGAASNHLHYAIGGDVTSQSNSVAWVKAMKRTSATPGSLNQLFTGVVLDVEPWAHGMWSTQTDFQNYLNHIDACRTAAKATGTSTPYMYGTTTRSPAFSFYVFATAGLSFYTLTSTGKSMAYEVAKRCDVVAFGTNDSSASGLVTRVSGSFADAQTTGVINMRLVSIFRDDLGNITWAGNSQFEAGNDSAVATLLSSYSKTGGWDGFQSNNAGTGWD